MPSSHGTFAGFIMGMQPHGHAALPAASHQHGGRWGEQGQGDQQGLQLSPPPSSAAPGSPRQAAMGRNRGLRPWRYREALQALMVARLLHPCPALPQQAACPLLFTGTAVLPPCSKHGCHSSSCTPRLPAPQCTLHRYVLCTPMHPAPLCPPPPCNLHPLRPHVPISSPPHPSSPPSPQLPESRASQPELGGGQGGSVWGCQGRGCPWIAPLKHVLDDSARPHTPCTPLPASACSLPAPRSCLHPSGFLKKRLTLRQALT